MSEPGSRLAEPIQKLLRWCDLNRHSKRKHEYRQGLSVTLYIDTAGRRHVMLARVGQVGPSAQEAQTVLKYWPEPVPASIEWIPRSVGRFSCLLAIWSMPTPAEQLALGSEEL